MKRRAGITFAVALLSLSIWSLTGYSADDDEKQAIKDAQKDILKLVDAMHGKGGDAKAQAAAIHKKYPELKPVMWVYKPRSKGGVGIGPKGDSIETEVAKIGNPRSKQKFGPKNLADLKPELIKAAELSKAVADVTDLYVPKKMPAKWKGYTQEMRKGADELIEAVNGGDVAKVKKAANNLSASCTNCHSDFRND